MMRITQLSTCIIRRCRSTAAAAPQGVCPLSRPPPPQLPPPKKSAPKPLLLTDAGLPAKPFSAVPCPKGLPLIGTGFALIRAGGAAKIHEYCDMRHKELGPIYREKMGDMDVVCISKTEYIKKVYNFEGKYPEHLVPEAWRIYNKMRGITRGVFFMDGSHWRSIRGYLNTILSPHVADQYVVVFNDVITNVVDRIGESCRDSIDGCVPCLETQLYDWSIETLTTMVFGRRMGCVAVNGYQREIMREFVQHVRQIFTETSTMAIIPPKIAISLHLPCWQKFVHAADSALAMARGFVLERIAEIEEAKKKGEPVGGILVQLLEVKNTNQEEIVSIVADLILAAADTTSHATQWAMYLLSKHPEAQERIISDINSVVPPGEMINGAHLRKMPYLLNVIKESLRLYPIASFLTRYLPTDLVLGDYQIPEGKLIFMSQYTIGRDPEKFKDPLKFNPDRWVRQPGVPTDDLNVCMPFGFGSRSCIGRKVAELKMQLLIARTIQRYNMECINESEVGIALRMVTTPDRPVRIRFTERER